MRCGLTAPTEVGAQTEVCPTRTEPREISKLQQQRSLAQEGVMGIKRHLEGRGR
jgi:hypothetical protein